LAADSRLKTDIPIGGGISSWGPNPSQDMYSEDKRLFVKQLQKFVLCTQKVMMMMMMMMMMIMIMMMMMMIMIMMMMMMMMMMMVL
jgi:nitrate/nitrite-specific signal transduction histidine kinase